MKKKLIRLTTIDNSLNILLKGQLKYLNKTFEVIGVANDSGVLSSVAKREGIRTIGVPMQRKISTRPAVTMGIIPIIPQRTPVHRTCEHP